ncbi:MAG: hypothetical protein GF409_00985 [Candidatus Omnitrophica bacterium]|nr:hypothetical protein [Candidatus Omnitrophota bacterium]
MRRLTMFMVICIFMFSQVPVYAQSSAAGGTYTSGMEPEEWAEDMDEKIDTTIKVLNVVKEELEDYKRAEAEGLSEAEKGEQSPEGFAARAAATIRRILRGWRKIRRATADDPDAADRATEQTYKRTEEMSRELSDKLDKTIRSMSAIKEELDKMEEEMRAEESE